MICKYKYLVFLILLSSKTIINAQDAKHFEPMVWYQIFPERFRNGLSENDPTIDVIIDKPNGWEVSKWTKDWYEMDRWEKDWSDNFYDIATKRRYGGDLIGVLEKLDYLDSLGINVIYFNPIFDAFTMHKYDASYYNHVDRYFGYSPINDAKLILSENPDDDSTWKFSSADSVFLLIIKKAHSKGIKIVLDGVFNHSGTNFWAFQDILKNGTLSKYKSWYKIISWDDLNTKENEFDYEGWWGYKGLPEFAQINGDLADGIKKHIFKITSRWMDPNSDGDPSDGIDGWRLDVAEEIGIPFWRDWHSHIRKINPNVFTIAELWDVNHTYYVADSIFTGVMNYPLTSLAHKYFINNAIQTSIFVDSINKINELYSKNHRAYNLNILDSHDTERLLTAIVNKNNTFKSNTKVQNNPNGQYSVEAPKSEDFQIFKKIVAFQFMMIGIPHIYYGDEIGMWGADDPDNRKPMVWGDLVYDSERNDPRNETRNIDSVLVNNELFDFYKKIIFLRKNEIDYKNSKFKMYSITNNVLVIESANKNKVVYGFFSNGIDTISLKKINPSTEYEAVDYFSGENIIDRIKLAKNDFRIVIFKYAYR